MIGKDKFAHFIYSTFGSAFIAVVLIALLSLSIVTGAVTGAILMLLIGLYKEIVHDKIQQKGTFEIADIIANVIGCGLGAVLIILLYQ